MLNYLLPGMVWLMFLGKQECLPITYFRVIYLYATINRKERNWENFSKSIKI